MSVFLKVKIKSLATEAKIIRHEERKFPTAAQAKKLQLRCGGQREEGGIYSQLHTHRTMDVRREARSAQLAYGIIRGRKYSQIEETCYDPPDMKRISINLRRFGVTRTLLDDKPMGELDVSIHIVHPWLEGKERTM